MKNFINHKCIVCAMVVIWSMACFCACEKEEEATALPEIIQQTESFDVELEPEPEIQEKFDETLVEEESKEVLEEITLEEFQAIVDQMAREMESKQEEIVQEYYDRTKAEEAFAKVNEQRRLHGLLELEWEESLYELACIRAKEISSKFSHERPDGGAVGDVIIREMGASGCGENIASNYQSTTNLINGWLNSEGHRENMLHANFTAGAMGCYYQNGCYYWVNLFWQ